MEWVYKKLGDLANVSSGGTPRKANKEFWNGDLPWYSSGELNDYYTNSPNEYITTPGLEGSNAKLFPKGSLLIGMYDTAALKMSILDRDGAFNQAIAGVKPNENIDLSFVLYAITNIKPELMKQRRGVRQKNLNQGKIKEIPIPALPVSEQKRIVAILDQAFADIELARAKTEQNLLNARELFESYLQQVFSQRGEGWVETTLGNVCEKVEYGTSSKSQPEGSIPVLRMGNIQGGSFDWDKLVYTDIEEDINKLLLKDNDVLFNRTNSPELVGKTAIYRNERPAIFAGYLIRIHRKKNLLDADYLNYYLNSKKARNHGYKVMSHSTNQANINGTKLKEYPINIPDLATQKKLVKSIRHLEGEIRKIEKIYEGKVSSLEELKNSILHLAFSGELTKAPDKDTKTGVAP